MEKKKNKIKLKADLKKNSIFILKKKFIINERSDTLILQNEYRKKNNFLENIDFSNRKILQFEKKFKSQEDINIFLKLKNISKNLGGRPILKDVSFELNNNQILGLLGPNGSGKSTLFNIIIGKINADFGHVEYFNEKIDKLPIYKRALKGISLLEQHKGLFGNMTAYENLYSILEIYMNDKNKIEDQINKLLSFFKLNYLYNVKANNMSGGEYKKISIIQRICNKNIKVLLLDEPMAALDPLSIQSLKEFILELKSLGLTIIITDHNFYAIHDILDKCIILKDGKLLTSGTPKEIIKDKKVVKYYLGQAFKI